MRRIWTVVMATAMGLAPLTAPAQQNMPSLTERLAIFSSSDKDDQQPTVRQTSAESHRASRAERNSPTTRTSGSSSGKRSLFGGLGGLFGGNRDGDDGDAPEGNGSHPMPYDPAELSSASQQQRRGAQPATQPGRQPAPRATATNQRGETAPVRRSLQGGSPAATRDRQQAAAQPARESAAPTTTTTIVNRTPRRSPTMGTQRGRTELDEAIADLNAAPSGSRYAAEGEAGAAPDYLDALDALAEPSRTTVARGPSGPSTHDTGRVQVSPQTIDFGRALSQRSGVRDDAPTDDQTSVDPSIIPDPASDALPVEVAARPPRTAPAQAAQPQPIASRDYDDLGSLLQEASPPPRQRAEVAQPAPESEVEQPQVASEAELAEEQFAATEPDITPTPVAAAQPIAEPQVEVAEMTPAADVLFTSRQPVIVSRVAGPQRLTVGRPATYEIVLQNLGKVGANELLAVVNVPQSATLLDASSSAGAIEQVDDLADGTQALHWEMQQLGAGETVTMKVQLTPRTGANLALGVRFSHAPVGSDAVVEVEEPLLTMSLQGPEVVQFGVAQRYKLVLTNPGTGPAEEVELELLPPGGDPSSMIRHGVGTLAAGESKELELELTAREAGELEMLASATATGGVKTAAHKTVRCVKPELDLDWRGPEEKYGNSVATYYLRVRNTGEAATDAVAVGVNLPEGAELVSASNGYGPGPDKNSIAWHGAALQPGEERFLQFKCRLAKPGANQIGLRAETPSGLLDQQTAETNVIAVADLKLDIADPKGPLPVGEPVVYEIRVRNRGAIAARGVSIVGLFSTGIDPTAVEGGKHTVRDGRVAFRAIDSLAAGDEVVLKIQAKAHDEGTHVFRAEVLCQDLEMKLSAEEMTKFFVEENPWDSAATAYGAEPPQRR